jgi:hypothetical protein
LGAAGGGARGLAAAGAVAASPRRFQPGMYPVRVSLTKRSMATRARHEAGGGGTDGLWERRVDGRSCAQRPTTKLLGLMPRGLCATRPRHSAAAFAFPPLHSVWVGHPCPRPCRTVVTYWARPLRGHAPLAAVYHKLTGEKSPLQERQTQLIHPCIPIGSGAVAKAIHLPAGVPRKPVS